MEAIPTSAARAASDIRTVFGRLRRRLREVAGLGDLTPSQTSVLSRLERGVPASASDLATLERVRPQSMAATLAAIQEHGLIQRQPDPADRRVHQLSLTPAGDKLRLSVQAAIRRNEEQLLAHLPDSDRAAFLRSLQVLDELYRARLAE